MIEEAAAEWKSNGWVVVEGLVPADEVAVALAEIPDQDEFATVPAGPALRADRPSDARFRSRQFDGTTLFPYPNAPKLNRLFVHPALIAFAEAALETSDLRIYQSRVWSKYGDHTDYEQPLHLDRNHSVVPVRQGPGWGHLECFLYLHDVDEQRGAPRAVPASIAHHSHFGDPGESAVAVAHAGPVSADEAPDLYAAEVSAEGKAGSLFAYRSDVWHRGVDLAPGVERHIIAVSFRPAHMPWINFDAHGPLVTRSDFVMFAEQCTPDELALFEVPRPGHDYWTADLLDEMALIYPRLDLSPWRRALQ